MRKQKIQTIAIILVLAAAIMIPAYSDAQTKSQTCSDETGCASGLQCTKFPEGRRCAKPNPCSYYQCPQGTKCEAVVIQKSGDSVIPAPQQGMLNALETPQQAPTSKSPSSLSALPLSPGLDQGGQQERSYTSLPTIALPTDEGNVSVFVGCWSGPPAIPSQPGLRAPMPAPAQDQASVKNTTTPEAGQEFELIYSLGGYYTGELPHTGGGGSGGTGGSAGSVNTNTGSVPVPVSGVTTASPNLAPAPISLWKSKTSEKTIIQGQSAAAEYVGGAVSVENDVLSIETSQGKQIIEATPDTAVAQTQAVMKNTEIEVKKVELKADIATGAPSYQVSTEESVKLFWFVPVTIKAETQVSATTGEVTSIKRPWWKVFAW